VGAAGGNAADAAAAAAAALTVILPDACGLGGDLLCIIRKDDGTTTAINGVGCAPAGLQVPLPTDGAQVAAVPGFVRGLCDLLVERLGFDVRDCLQVRPPQLDPDVVRHGHRPLAQEELESFEGVARQEALVGVQRRCLES